VGGSTAVAFGVTSSKDTASVAADRTPDAARPDAAAVAVTPDAPRDAEVDAAQIAATPPDAAVAAAALAGSAAAKPPPVRRAVTPPKPDPVKPTGVGKKAAAPDKGQTGSGAQPGGKSK
jgi:hypothetical protein